MKKYFLLVTLFLLGQRAFCQDYLGGQFDQVMQSVRNSRGMLVETSGDTLIRSSENQKEQYFTYRFDPSTHVCYQQEMQLDLNGVENVALFKRSLKREKAAFMRNVGETTVYQGRNCDIISSKNGNLVTLNFKLHATGKDALDNSGQGQPPLISSK